ncbi:hypothetical protein GCM10018779_58610 [Streptomyces griseocarneus]|nr:hypothetical protein GCM10018779_58610 [Streptomyces griseocarneus]
MVLPASILDTSVGGGLPSVGHGWLLFSNCAVIQAKGPAGPKQKSTRVSVMPPNDAMSLIAGPISTEIAEPFAFCDLARARMTLSYSRDPFCSFTTGQDLQTYCRLPPAGAPTSAGWRS